MEVPSPGFQYHVQQIIQGPTCLRKRLSGERQVRYSQFGGADLRFALLVTRVQATPHAGVSGQPPDGLHHRAAPSVAAGVRSPDIVGQAEARAHAPNHAHAASGCAVPHACLQRRPRSARDSECDRVVHRTPSVRRPPGARSEAGVAIPPWCSVHRHDGAFACARMTTGCSPSPKPALGFGISDRTSAELWKKGVLHAVRIGGSVRIRESELLRLVADPGQRRCRGVKALSRAPATAAPLLAVMNGDTSSRTPDRDRR